MGKRKSLAEELAELTSVAPSEGAHEDTIEFNPIVESDVDEEAQDAQQRNSTKGQLSLKSDIILNEEAYMGKPTTRAQAFGDQSETSISELLEGEDDDDDVDDDGDELETDVLYSNGVSNLAGPSDRHSDSEEEGSGSEAISDDEENGKGAEGMVNGRLMDNLTSDDDIDDDDDDDDLKMGEVGNEGDGDDLYDAYNKLHAEDTVNMKKLKDRALADREKGKAVKRQKYWWEQWLGVRILLQKCLNGANQLPGKKANEVFRKSEEAKKSMEDLYDECSSTLHSLLSLHTEMVTNNPHIKKKRKLSHNGTENMGKTGAKETGGLDELWSAIENCYESWGEFRDTSIDRYHRQAMLQSGGGVQKGHLKVLHQGISAQVALMLQNPWKLVKRSQLLMSERPKVFGDLPNESVEPPIATESPEESEMEGVEQQPRDSETFDDSQFYQQLLKEFLEGQGLNSVAVGAAVKKNRRKKAHIVHPPSKDRALRYNVHEKLVNFMTPVEWEPAPLAKQLFVNLFGHRAH